LLRILDIFKQSWYSTINNSNWLETYCLFKHEFIFESYLDQIRDSRFRIWLTQLAIEKCRHQNIARQERVCNNCTMSVLETEYHYVLICPKFYKNELYQNILLYMAYPTQTNTTSII